MVAGVSETRLTVSLNCEPTMDFKIERPSPTCATCSHKYRDGEELTTALVQVDDKPTFKRLDICSRCFNEQDQSQLTCFWANTHSEKRRSPLLDVDVLWQVFHNTQPKGESDEKSREFAYVASLGLMRLKQLKLDTTKKKGDVEYLVFHTKGNKSQRSSYEVRDPRLDEKGIERVQDNLADFDAVGDEAEASA